jgi:Fe-S-cluster containining protein
MGVRLVRNDVWYARSGLRFACTRCGACCKRPGFVYLTRVEGDRIAERLQGPDANADTLLGELWVEDEDGLLVIDVPEEAACPLLGPNGCTVHDIKPMQCASYPFWPEILGSERKWKAEKKYCEGINDAAETYSADDVLSILSLRRRTRNC